MSDNNEQLIATPGVFGDNSNFLLERELGRGGMGGVYMGRDKMLDRPVAVKVMLKEYGSDQEFVTKFKKEAQAAAKLIHPNIAQIYSYGISAGMPYIAMELVAGGSLQQVMNNAKNGKTDIPRVLKICEQTAQALRAAADQGLVHGDIKPDNILLDFNGNAKLVDFGLAGMQKDTSEIWGTPYYIAPEKLKKQPVDYRADMYNLGGTLYHALTGIAPFEGPDATAVVRKRFEGKPKKPSEIRPEIPPAVDALVMKMLELDKNDRYPTFEALLEAFKKVMATGLSKDKNGRKMTVRTTRHMTSPRLANPKLNGEGGASEAEGKYIEEEDHGDPMKKVMIFVGIIIGVIVLAIGGGVFYFYSTNKTAAEQAQNNINAKIVEGKKAIRNTCNIIEKFGSEVEELSQKATAECEKATKEIAVVVPEFANQLKPKPPQELLDAIAGTNATTEADAAAAAEIEAEKKAKEKGEKAKAAPVAKAKVRKFRPPTEEESDPASPEYEDYMRMKREYESGQGDSSESSEESEVQTAESNEPVANDASETSVDDSGNPNDPINKLRASLKNCETRFQKEIKTVGLDAVKDVNDLWGRAYSCQLSAINIQKSINNLMETAAQADKMNTLNMKTAEAISELSRKVKELHDDIKGCKDVENIQKGVSYIRQKGEKSLNQTKDNLYRRRMEIDREIKRLQNEIERLVRERNNAENRKRLVAQEQEAAATKFDAIQQNKNFELLEWDSAIRELEFLKSTFKTSEGQIAVDEQLKKVRAMKSVQEILVRNLKDYKFRKNKLGRMKTTVLNATMKEIQLSRPEGGESSRNIKFNINWVKFYKEYHGNFNELINQFIELGRVNSNPKLTLQEWGDAMCGAALTFRIICADDSAAEARVEQITKDVAREFPGYIKNLRMMFPDISFDDAEEE